MRSFLASAAVLVVACAGPPPPAVPTDPRTVAPPAASAPPTASTSAASVAPDEGTPPDPPMALQWTFRLPAFGGQPATTQRLSLGEKGDATWESARSGGDGDVDEELSPTAPSPPVVERCRGHVDPARHRKLVVAARQTMASGCAQAVARDRLGRPADGATTTLEVTWAGAAKACDVGRSGGTYAAFDKVRADVVTSICARH